MRRKLFLILLLLISFFGITVSAANLIPYKTANGTTLKYRNSQVDVMIPDEYIEKDADFRAVWITHLVGDFASYTSESQYKSAVTQVFNVMEYYNLNAMIFHVRTHNNALYKSDLNPVSSYYSRANFDVFDPLKYIIDEAHKRGIEFHAWMNPYRLTTTYSGTVEQYAATQPSYNIASDPKMILKSGNNLILNPGEPRVREFLIDTVIELMERYDVDAIHFDDYFYISGVDDTTTRNKYNPENLSLGDWRRKQVDIFIRDLSNAMYEYNIDNGRAVQLGISPSGIYNNVSNHVPLSQYKYDENGTLTYPLGSNTAGMAHYDNYLYSDTKKWIDEEWIDYIIPQTYWAMNHPVAGYADIMDWWNMVVKNKKVNLYSGMGPYMAIESSNTYDWKSNEKEALNQILYSSKLEYVQGHSIYSYKHIAYAYAGTINDLFKKNFNHVKESAWTKLSLLPESRRYDTPALEAVSNLHVTTQDGKNVVKFGGIADAKFYVVYRNRSEVKFNNDEIVGIFASKDAMVSFVDEVNGEYNYGVKAMNNANVLGAGAISTKVTPNTHIVTFKDSFGNVLKTETVFEGDSAIAPKLEDHPGYKFVGWDKEFTNITSSITVTAIYTQSQYTVKFLDKDGNLIKEVKVDEGENVTPPTAPEVEGYKFIKWDTDTINVTSDLIISAIYEKVYYIKFIVDQEEIVRYTNFDNFDLPQIPVKEGYDKVLPYWDETDFSNVTSDIEVIAVYTINQYIVRFIDKDGNLLEEVEVTHGESVTPPIAPEIEGYKFRRWDFSTDEVTRDLEVTAIYNKAGNTIPSCKSFSFSLAIFSFGLILFVFFRRRK